MRRGGWLVNRKRVRRLYRLDGFRLRIRAGRRTPIALHRGPAPVPLGPTERWSMDCVLDTWRTGDRFGSFDTVPYSNRVSDDGRDGRSGARSCPGHTRVLRSITVDHGTEFQSREMEDWAYRRGVQLDFIRPGQPMDNAFIESFNG